MTESEIEREIMRCEMHIEFYTEQIKRREEELRVKELIIQREQRMVREEVVKLNNFKKQKGES